MCVSLSGVPSMLISPMAPVRYVGESMLGIKNDKFWRATAVINGPLDPMGSVSNKAYENEKKEQEKADKRSRQLLNDYYAKAAPPSPFTTYADQSRKGAL